MIISPCFQLVFISSVISKALSNKLSDIENKIINRVIPNTKIYFKV